MFPADAGYLPPLPSFRIAVDPPAVDPDEGTQQAFCFAEEWLPYVLAALAALTLPTTWVGDEADVLLAQQRASLLLALVGSPDEGCGGNSATCPYYMRYDVDTDMFQTSIDGGETWTDAPEFDPRRINQLPPPSGADPRCDAAARMSAALAEIAAAVIDALQAGAAAADIGAVIIGWLGVFAGFALLLAFAVELAALLVSIGYTDLYNAFVTFDWDEFSCRLLCYVNDEGRLSEGALLNFRSSVLPTYTATQQTMLNIALDIAGFGGLNDFGAYRTETGDCEACDPCGFLCVTFDNPDDYTFTTRLIGIAPGYVDGSQGQPAPCGHSQFGVNEGTGAPAFGLGVQIDFPGTVHLDHFSADMLFHRNVGTAVFEQVLYYTAGGGLITQTSRTYSGTQNAWHNYAFATSVDCARIVVWMGGEQAGMTDGVALMDNICLEWS